MNSISINNNLFPRCAGARQGLWRLERGADAPHSLGEQQEIHRHSQR